jgi:hypothetical protein
VGSDQSEAADEAFALNTKLSDQQYSLGKGALQGGLSYLTDAYKGGGYDQSAKFSAMQGLTMDKMAGANPAARAQALAGVTNQKITAGMDEMNKIRSMLAGQGLKTTGLAEQAAGQSASAIGGMYGGNKTEDIIKGVGAVGSSIYGAGQQGGWWGANANRAPGDVATFTNTGASIPGMDPSSYTVR